MNKSARVLAKIVLLTIRGWAADRCYADRQCDPNSNNEVDLRPAAFSEGLTASTLRSHGPC
jgi:hypothetical protein